MYESLNPASNRRQAYADALDMVLGHLDGWIETQRENHEAMGHHGEPIGEECWNTWTPEDFRSMVQDARRSLIAETQPTVPPKTFSTEEAASPDEKVEALHDLVRTLREDLLLMGNQMSNLNKQVNAINKRQARAAEALGTLDERDCS